MKPMSTEPGPESHSRVGRMADFYFTRVLGLSGVVHGALVAILLLSPQSPLELDRISDRFGAIVLQLSRPRIQPISPQPRPSVSLAKIGSGSGRASGRRGGNLPGGIGEGEAEGSLLEVLNRVGPGSGLSAGFGADLDAALERLNPISREGLAAGPRSRGAGPGSAGDSIGIGFGPGSGLGDGGNDGNGLGGPRGAGPGTVSLGPRIGLRLEAPEDSDERDCVSASVIRRVMNRMSSQARGCYERGLQRRPGLQGKVVTRFTIGSEGRAQSAVVTQSTLADPGVEQCLVRLVGRARFPACEGGTAEITYPWLFQQAGGE